MDFNESFAPSARLELQIVVAYAQHAEIFSQFTDGRENAFLMPLEGGVLSCTDQTIRDPDHPDKDYPVTLVSEGSGFELTHLFRCRACRFLDTPKALLENTFRGDNYQLDVKEQDLLQVIIKAEYCVNLKCRAQ
ncbi:hypothetical protein Tco_1418553 [Tanacetum coccineum]